jgi:hypothetical protein
MVPSDTELAAEKIWVERVVVSRDSLIETIDDTKLATGDAGLL